MRALLLGLLRNELTSSRQILNTNRYRAALGMYELELAYMVVAHAQQVR